MKGNIELEKEKFKVYLVGGYLIDDLIDYSMEELKNLANSLDCNVVGQTTQHLKTINSAHYIGKGKIEEIKEEVKRLDAREVIFNDELSAIQLKNLQAMLGVRVTDRTFLILEIFALRAKTKEAKLQVEIARLKYELPRIRGSYTKFERQRGGGNANKGKGEGLISLEKKRAEQKISSLEKELNKVIDRQHYQKQSKNDIFNIALVGYTNAGKSTLLNQLVKLPEDKKMFAKDLLFATLDSTSRKVNLIPGLNSVISDTVGFVDKLPTELLKAFQSTLSVVTKADLIIHVVDSQSPFLNEQKETTLKTLDILKIDPEKIIEVYNKADHENISNKLSISALNGRNITYLQNEIIRYILKDYTFKKEKISYKNYFKINDYRKNKNIINLIENKKDDFIEITYFEKNI